MNNGENLNESIDINFNTLKYILIGAGLISVIGVIIFLNRRKLANIYWEATNRTENNIKSLHPRIRKKARMFVDQAKKKLGKKVAIIAGFRTRKDQEELYYKYIKESGALAAPPGKSWHEYGLAFDAVEIEPKYGFHKNYPISEWEKLGILGENLGFKWGGRWSGKNRDRPHYQRTFDLTINEAKNLIAQGKTVKDKYPRIGIT